MSICTLLKRQKDSGSQIVSPYEGGGAKLILRSPEGAEYKIIL